MCSPAPAVLSQQLPPWLWHGHAPDSDEASAGPLTIICTHEKTVLSSIQWQIAQNYVVPLYSLTELIEIKIIDVRFSLESYRLRGLTWGLRKGWGVKEVINQDRKRFVIALEQVQLVPSSGDNLTFFSFHPENQTSRCNRPILTFPNGHFGSLPKTDSSRFKLEVVLRSFGFLTMLIFACFAQSCTARNSLFKIGKTLILHLFKGPFKRHITEDKRRKKPSTLRESNP